MMEEKPIDTGTGLLHTISCSPEELPERFQNPFRYAPCPAVVKAAEEVMRHLGSDRELDRMFREGKMLGVLIVKMPATDTATLPPRYAFLAAFSGNVCGHNSLPYFVPPVFDLLAPEGHFKKEEARISELNREILRLQQSPEYISASENLQKILAEKEAAVSAWKERMAESKRRRERIRQSLSASVPAAEEDIKHYISTSSGEKVVQGISQEATTAQIIPEGIGAMLTRESQFEKAELRRITERYRTKAEEAASSLSAAESRIRQMKEMRKEMSDRLQKWIFDSFTVMNALGESRSISAIFREKDLVPPGGTGECAAPKLLQYAFSLGLQPVAMGEFWYGASPADEIRSHGRFYPSCSSKCGPLLDFMLQGMDIMQQGNSLLRTSSAPNDSFHIIYEDSHLAVIDKPPGIPSVPGKTGTKSVLEMLQDAGKNVLEVHRLDMDTSGNEPLPCRKRAHIDNCPHPLRPGEKGTISLPLSPDLNDRPRQTVDRSSGKEAVTEYEITDIKGNLASVRFRPLTGRTHQLRVHSAHPDGLGAPIAGDPLYGSPSSAPRLCLHATSLAFTHPATGKRMQFSSPPAFSNCGLPPEKA